MALEGKELLSTFKALTAEGKGKSAIAKACGYVRVVAEGDRAGTEIPDIGGLQQAMLTAAGFQFAAGERFASPRGVIRKTKANLLIVGSPYHADAVPGDEYKVEVKDNGEIHLLPLFDDEEAA